jgi:hypothetical protein
MPGEVAGEETPEEMSQQGIPGLEVTRE